MMTPTLRWGILGTGGIARKFAAAVSESTTGTLAAVGSRAQASADAFGAAFGAARSHSTYDALLADESVQAVYISLPNHLHALWIEKCARAGKHILCEKPLTINHAEAARALAVVRQAGVFLMEAFMYRCHPQTARLAELLAEAIGEVRLIQSSFCYNLGPQYENIRLSNPAAGGGIMDVGCYTVSLACLAAGGEPNRVTGVAHIGGISRVDEHATASVGWPGGCVAALSCGTQVSVSREAFVWGSTGSLRVANPWFPGPGDDNVILVHRANKDPEEIRVPGKGVGLYTHEADLVAWCVAEGRTEAPAPAMTWDDSLNNMKALDAWRGAVGLVFDAEK